MNLSVRSVRATRRLIHHAWYHLYLCSSRTILRDRTWTHLIDCYYFSIDILSNIEIEWRLPKGRHWNSTEHVQNWVLRWTVTKTLDFLISPVVYLEQNLVSCDSVEIVERACPLYFNVNTCNLCWRLWGRAWSLASLEWNWVWISQSWSIFINCHHLISVSLASYQTRVWVSIGAKRWGS